MVEQEKVQFRQEIDHLHDRLLQAQGNSEEVAQQLIEKEAELELVRIQEREARCCIDTINEQLQLQSTSEDNERHAASVEPSSTAESDPRLSELDEELQSLQGEVRELVEIRSNLVAKLEESRKFEKEQTAKWISQIETIRQENTMKFEQLKQKTSEEVSRSQLELQGAIISRPYIEMTLNLMKKQGYQIQKDCLKLIHNQPLH